MTRACDNIVTQLRLIGGDNDFECRFSLPIIVSCHFMDLLMDLVFKCAREDTSFKRGQNVVLCF